MAASKMRLVANQVRGRSVEEALHVLSFSTRRAAGVLRKVLDSAVANAEHNEGVDVDALYVRTIYVDEGPRQKRTRPRARGRSDRICKSSCHVTVGLSDGE